MQALKVLAAAEAEGGRSGARREPCPEAACLQPLMPGTCGVRPSHDHFASAAAAGSAWKLNRAEANWRLTAAKLGLYKSNPKELKNLNGYGEMARLDRMV